MFHYSCCQTSVHYTSNCSQHTITILVHYIVFALFLVWTLFTRYKCKCIIIRSWWRTPIRQQKRTPPNNQGGVGRQQQHALLYIKFKLTHKLHRAVVIGYSRLMLNTRYNNAIRTDKQTRVHGAWYIAYGTWCMIRGMRLPSDTRELTHHC